MTLIEVLLASALMAVLMTVALTIYQATYMAREDLDVLAEPMSIGPMIMDSIEEDIRNLWVFDIKEGRALEGVNFDIVGVEADKLHMIVAGRTLTAVPLDNQEERSLDLAEVSYVLRSNPDNPDLLELWRREDPSVDEEWTKGGTYALLSNRVRSFNIRYYTDFGKEAEPKEEWRSRDEKKLPRRIEVELVLERSADTFREGFRLEFQEVGGRTIKHSRQILLPREYVDILGDELALAPVIPDKEPDKESSGGGPLGPGGPGQGPGGPGGPGRPGIPGGPGTATKAEGSGQRQPGTTAPLPDTGNRTDIEDLLRRIGGRAGGGR
ncbi:MAG: hypothetical protein R3F30_01960 [Planctomycetota bacterium]